jgi:hypothetical protein
VWTGDTRDTRPINDIGQHSYCSSEVPFCPFRDAQLS